MHCISQHLLKESEEKLPADVDDEGEHKGGKKRVKAGGDAKTLREQLCDSWRGNYYEHLLSTLAETEGHKQGQESSSTSKAKHEAGGAALDKSFHAKPTNDSQSVMLSKAHGEENSSSSLKEGSYSQGLRGRNSGAIASAHRHPHGHSQHAQVAWAMHSFLINRGLLALDD